jgi:PII-like signaling protein
VVSFALFSAIAAVFGVNTGLLMENTDNIFNLGSDLSVVVAKVDKNEQDIAKNVTELGQHTGWINKNEVDILANAGNISKNTTQLDANTGLLMKNTDDIFNTGSDLAVVVAKVDKNKQDIAANNN